MYANNMEKWWEGAEPCDVPVLLTMKKVLERVPASRPTIWTWVRRGQFPAPRQVGGRSFWVESEIDAWRRLMPERQYKRWPPK
jgi:predicted DNA-binding transcriptional regulator AlpA